jgi:hypothetical protein
MHSSNLRNISNDEKKGKKWFLDLKSSITK